MTTERGDAPQLSGQGLQSTLLRWAVENATVDDDKSSGGMDPVRKEQAMKSIKDLGPEWYEAIFGKSDVDVMKEQIVVLQKFFEGSAEDVTLERAVQGLEQVGYLVELTHNANDFPKIGGFGVLMNSLRHSASELRMHACWIIGKSASNNPEFQGKILGTDALPVLINMLSEDPDRAVSAKALHAVSCIVRQSEDGMKGFISNKGFDNLCGLLVGNGDRNVQARCVFFMNYCLGADPSHTLANLLLEGGLVRDVLVLLRERDFDIREKVLSMLTELSRVGGPMFTAIMQSIDARESLEGLLNDEENWLKEESDEDHFDVVEMAKQLVLLV